MPGSPGSKAAARRLQLLAGAEGCAGRRRTLLLEDPEDLAAGDVADLRDAVRVAQVDTDSRRGEALLRQLADVVDDLRRVLLEPGGGCAAVRQGTLRDALPARQGGKGMSAHGTSHQGMRCRTGRFALAEEGKEWWMLSRPGAGPAGGSLLRAATQGRWAVQRRTPCCAYAPWLLRLAAPAGLCESLSLSTRHAAASAPSTWHEVRPSTWHGAQTPRLDDAAHEMARGGAKRRAACGARSARAPSRRDGRSRGSTRSPVSSSRSVCR